MSLFDAYPAAVNAPVQRARWTFRAWRKLHDWHQAKRAELPEIPTATQVRTFWEWERATWLPRMKRLSIANADAQNYVRDLGGDFSIALDAIREPAELDKYWDPLVKLEQLKPAGRKLPAKRLHGTEDFTTYTEGTDTDGVVSATSSRVSSTLMRRDAQDSWFAKDFGAAHFDGDFEHLLEMQLTDISAFTSSPGCFWGLTTAVNNRLGIRTTGESMLGVFISDAGPQNKIYVVEEHGGSLRGTYYSTNSFALLYFEFERDESVGTYGTLYCRIYSDASRTSLLYTISLTMREKVDYQYALAMQCFGAASDSDALTGMVQNVDLQETAPTTPDIRPLRSVARRVLFGLAI